MRKLAMLMRDSGYDNIPATSGLSNKFNKKTIRFKEVQEILDFLGYELVIREKK